MSRIGKKPVPIGSREGERRRRLVQDGRPQGQAGASRHPVIKVALDAGKKELVVTRPDDERQSKALHGLTRALLANMVDRRLGRVQEIAGNSGRGLQGGTARARIWFSRWAMPIDPRADSCRAGCETGRREIHVSGPTSSWSASLPATCVASASRNPIKARASATRAKWSRSRRARRLPALARPSKAESR